MFSCQKKKHKLVGSGPYRIAAVMPQEPISKPVKKPWKISILPKIKMSKPVRLFLMMIPVCLSIVGSGYAHDSSFLSEGTKWGVGMACAAMGVFFFILLVAEAEKNG